MPDLLERRARRRWAAAARAADDVDIPRLKSLRRDALSLRRHIDRVLHAAEGRLALPLIGADTIRAPLHSDWTFRPDAWRGPVTPHGLASVANRAGFSADVMMFHDCPLSEISMRQIRNDKADDLCPFSLRIDVFRFRGSFLSAVIALPAEAVANLRRRHIIGLEAEIETERPIEIFARLNVRHGPNTEQIVREFDRARPRQTIDFDLFYTDINERRIERAWLDLIFENPELNQITIRDMALTRRPRAEV